MVRPRRLGRPASCPRVGVQIHPVRGRLARSAHLIAKTDCQESPSTRQQRAPRSLVASPTDPLIDWAALRR
jgi:hypothetical protein